MFTVRCSEDPALREMLSRHPFVELSPDHAQRFEWAQESWRRHLSSGDEREGLYGLVELMDNNPLVCADCFSVPSPASTLAAIALGPLARASLISDEVMMASNLEEPADFPRLLEEIGVSHPVIWSQLGEPAQIALLSALVPVPEMDDDSALDSLFEEAYGRSFYVRQTTEMNPEMVQGKPFAIYQLRITPGDGQSLLNVSVMADRDGKLGAAQMVHAFNVMCGFEESVGIE